MNASCESCRGHFAYALYHSGFSDCAYAYCDSCGRLAMFDAWAENIPANTKLKVHGPIEAHLEPLISTCECGGSFRSNAPPRCPLCSAPLSADAATAYIERNAEGTAKGWRWDRTWSGIYCMDVEKKAAKNPWLAQGT